MNNLINVVGLDPSMSNFGVAKCTLDIDSMTLDVNSFEVVKTAPEKDKAMRKTVRKNSEDLERAKVLHKGALQAVDGAWLAFIEIPVGSQSSRAMASYGICIGVIAAVAAVLPIVQVTPNDVKLAGCGIRTATKDEMIAAMMTKYPNAPWPMKTSKGVKSPIAGECEHLADALAAIEAGLKTDEFRATVAMFKNAPVFRTALRSA